jgi:hypothetical protein
MRSSAAPLSALDAVHLPKQPKLALQNYASVDTSSSSGAEDGAPGQLTGYLVKRSLGKHNYKNSNWKRRYFVMDRTSITYFNDSTPKSMKKPKGVFPLTPLSFVIHGSAKSRVEAATGTEIQKPVSEIRSVDEAHAEIAKLRKVLQHKLFAKDQRDRVLANILSGADEDEVVLPPPTAQDASAPPQILPPPQNAPPQILPPPSLPPPGTGVQSEVDEVALPPPGRTRSWSSAPIQAAEHVPVHIAEYYFAVASGSFSLHLAAEDEERLEKWVKSIQENIADLQKAQKGYLRISEGRWANMNGTQQQRCVLQGGKWQEFYCVLLPDTLHLFNDQSLQDTIGGYKFDLSSSIDDKVMVGSNTENDIFALNLHLATDETSGEVISDDGAVTTKMYFKADSTARKTAWVDSLDSTLKSFPALWARMESTHTEMYERDATFYSMGRPDMGKDAAEEEEDPLSEKIVGKKGHLKKQPMTSASAKWQDRFFVLDNDKLSYYQDEYSHDPKGYVYLNAECSVKKLDEPQFGVQLVGPGKVLVLQAYDERACDAWYKAINLAIEIQIHHQHALNPVEEKAALLVDEFQEVEYTEADLKSQNIGVTFSQRRQWAIVCDKVPGSPVPVGSVLQSINGEAVIQSPYKHAIALLSDWRPPLKLVFRQCASCEGILMKQNRTYKGNAGVGMRKVMAATSRGLATDWKNRYFILPLGGAALQYYAQKPSSETVEDDSSKEASTEGGTADAVAGAQKTSKMRGEFSLKRSALKLLSDEEAGRPNCFLLVNGTGELLVQASTSEEYTKWTASLYRAIALANGGGFLLYKGGTGLGEGAAPLRKSRAMTVFKDEDESEAPSPALLESVGEDDETHMMSIGEERQRKFSVIGDEEGESDRRKDKFM